MPILFPTPQTAAQTRPQRSEPTRASVSGPHVFSAWCPHFTFVKLVHLCFSFRAWRGSFWTFSGDTPRNRQPVSGAKVKFCSNINTLSYRKHQHRCWNNILAVVARLLFIPLVVSILMTLHVTGRYLLQFKGGWKSRFSTHTVSAPRAPTLPAAFFRSGPVLSYSLLLPSGYSSLIHPSHISFC